jgi:hypothetical protein
MALRFAGEYARLETLFRERATEDGDFFLPNIPPLKPVDFIFIAMEPSLKRWAKSCQDAQIQIASGFKNFLFSIEDFILHFCIRTFLCREGQTYHLTDLSKGAMSVERAIRNKRERYDRWYPLLKEEIALVGKPNVKIFAIGKQVENFLRTKRFEHLTGTLLHYSSQASGYRGKPIQGREREFKQFAATVELNAVAQVAQDVLAEARVSDSTTWKILARIRKSNLSHSRKELIFGYKLEFDKWSERSPHMITFKEHYILDGSGKRVAVILDLADYEQLLDELEELQSIRAYDAAKASGDEAIPFEQAVTEIEQDR